MKLKKILFSIAVLIFFSLNSSNAFAQSETKQTENVYEITFQTLVGSNAAGEKTDVPPSLAGVVRKLKTVYTNGNYRLTSTYFQRVAQNGTIESRNLINNANGNQDNQTPIFSEWSLSEVKSLPDSKGRNSIQFQSFRFGQRTPVKTSIFNGETGKTSSVVNYEQIALTLNKSAVTENVPTVIGSLPMPSGEIIFIVLSVKSVDE